MKLHTITSFLFAAVVLTGQTPRMPDGKPNFAGVWAGPAFTHIVGPGDTDAARH